MTAVQVPALASAEAVWQAVVDASGAWAAECGLALDDAVLIVPAAHHIALAQRAYGRAGFALPRIETAHTLAMASAPPAAPESGQLCFDTATDRLVASRLLSRSAGRGRAAMAHAAATVVDTAHAVATACAALPPDRRGAEIARWRQRLFPTGDGGGRGQRERALAQVAFEWAALAPPPATDALFSLRPAGWIVVSTDLADAPATAVSALLEAAVVPTLAIDASLAADAQAALARHADWTVSRCDDFEDEAQRSAAAVIAHLNAGCTPVALVAQDRLLVRRVHALLARQRVPVKDETGWTMSTTRAAAALRSVLRCARRGAGCDDWLDWLKSCPGADPAAVGAIEQRWRADRVRTLARVDPGRLPATAAAVWDRSTRAMVAFSSPARRPLAQWHAAFAQALATFELDRVLGGDDAGAQLLAALRLNPLRAPPQVDPAWSIDLDTYAGWIEAGMESRAFLPPFEAGVGASAPAVVITPLGRAALRPFSAIVFPGADGDSLGAASVPSTLFGAEQAAVLGLADRDAAQARQGGALAQLLRQPRIDFLHRAEHAGEPMPESPSLQWLRSARPGAAPSREEARTVRRVPGRPVPQPLPSAAALLPDRLSASACETLRACPYRFHALRVLKLKEAEELDTEADKRDYGTWLHAALHAFHRDRPAPHAEAHDRAALLACGEAAAVALGLDAADTVPFAASFQRFAPRYVAWLQARDALGAQWLSGETELTATPPPWGGIAMRGIVDRLDALPECDADGIALREIIDYKTSSRQPLEEGLKTAEDTQLAFYAALIALQPGARGALQAAYLLLDDAKGIVALACADVADCGDALVEGIGHDLRRLRAGAAMPALGEGTVCTHCAARGLCRRDHWAPPAVSPARPGSDAAA